MDVSGLFDLTGKHALVTGASVGIGRMIADGLAAAGATVHLVARTAEDLDRVVAEITAGAFPDGAVISLDGGLVL